MKKKKVLSIFIPVICAMSLAINVSAEESLTIPSDGEEQIVVPIDSKPILEIEDDAIILSEETVIENGIITTTVVSRQSDGDIVTDELSYSANLLRSSQGSDTVSRTKTIENWGTLTIKATFSWRTEGLFAYVKCNSATFNKNLTSGVTYSDSSSSTSYTSTEVSIGSANAKWEYYLYMTSFPVSYKSGTLKITCTDGGTISDSGF